MSIKAAFVVVSMFFGLIVGVQPAVANDITCDTSFGTKIPVLMVHGFDSRPRMWREGTPSMEGAVESVNGIEVVKPFDYYKDRFEWVTNPNIGPKLAKTIDCLAQASRKNGGPGKVITVGHSMGGLALEYASNQMVDGRKVSDELGSVSTFGTPYRGSEWGNATTSVATSVCQGLASSLTLDPLIGLAMTKDTCLANLAFKGLSKDSDELQRLKPFPSSVPVRTIAGDVSVMTQILFASNITPTHSDHVVGVDSAEAEHSGDAQGGGSFIFRCFTRVKVTLERPWLPFPNNMDASMHLGECWHNAMVQTSYIQWSVVNGIRDYLPSVSFAPPNPDFGALGNEKVTMFNRLTIPAPKTWSGTMSQPDTVMDFVDQTRCDGPASACPHVEFVNRSSSGRLAYYGVNPLKKWAARECLNGNSPGNVEGPVALKLGGEPANVYRQQCGSGSAEYRYAWGVPGKALVVLSNTGGSPEITEAALEGARWR